ncbi:hypothetical protein BBI17_008193 [Phytophthora kernoviae]|uniref:Uncharacterized protein n=1 Tax=Phytophthora kernoviae TaxID=325452 RepID=A0A3R7MNK9_9STRA|nr:hypothetical protein JM16_008107 [Phytophthora kernoviae]RLN14481.1 hypothetical protein BBI17_008193 [Phytophthora kernoviae]
MGRRLFAVNDGKEAKLLNLAKHVISHGRNTFYLSHDSSLALFGVVSTVEVQSGIATTLRTEADIAPAHREERNLGIFDWLFKSPTAAPDNNNNNDYKEDKGILGGPFYDEDAVIF